MLKALWRLIKETFLKWRRDNASELAAALAFYAVLSFAPMFVIVVAIGGMAFGKKAVEGELVSQMQGWIGVRGAELLQTVIASARKLSSGVIATVVSFLTILFGATRLFAQLQLELNRSWGVRLRPQM